MMNPKADAYVEKAVMELYGQPGMMTGFVVCAAVVGLDGQIRYVTGGAVDQPVHVSMGLNIILSTAIDETYTGDYGTVGMEED